MTDDYPGSPTYRGTHEAPAEAPPTSGNQRAEEARFKADLYDRLNAVVEQARDKVESEQRGVPPEEMTLETASIGEATSRGATIKVVIRDLRVSSITFNPSYLTSNPPEVVEAEIAKTVNEAIEDYQNRLMEEIKESTSGVLGLLGDFDRLTRDIAQDTRNDLNRLFAEHEEQP